MFRFNQLHTRSNIILRANTQETSVENLGLLSFFVEYVISFEYTNHLNLENETLTQVFF